jgi:hypothetical protein
MLIVSAGQPIPRPIFAHTGDGGGMYRLSRCVPLAHEDKTFQTRITPRSRPASECRFHRRICCTRCVT